MERRQGSAGYGDIGYRTWNSSGSDRGRERGGVGSIATPAALALDIARHAAERWRGRPDRVTFLDPALGTGSFSAALRQAFPAGAIADACGLEIASGLAGVAKALWESTGLRVILGDFTRLVPDRPYNLVLTNPPYVRHHHLPREDKERLKTVVSDRLGMAISGLAGLSAHFLLLSDAWLADGGLAVWLTPSEFMDVNYGSALKSSRTEHVTLQHIHRYGPSDGQFGDAMVTSAIVAFDKAPPRQGHEVRISFGGRLSAPNTSESVPLAMLHSTRK